MPPKAGPSTRTSLYRLENLSTLRSAIQDKYLERDSFTDRDLQVGKRTALLVTGTMDTETVKWAKTIQTLTDQPLALGNRLAAAVLIISDAKVDSNADEDPAEDTDRDREEDPDPDQDGAADEETEADVGQRGGWALAYGMGFQMLRQDKVDGGFGQRIAIRVANPRELNSLTRTTLDQRSRIDRLSNPSGDHLRGYGVGDFGEIVTRLVANASIPSLTGGEQPIRIRGADALSVPLGKKPDHLLADLDALQAILAQPAAAGLEVLEQLVAIKNRPELVAKLDNLLNNALGDVDGADLGLSWPHERIDDNGTPSSFKITGAGRRHTGVQDGVPDVSSLAAALQDEAPTAKLHRLRRLGIMLFRDDAGDDPISPVIPGDRWVAFETDEDNKRYCFHDGRWYLMDEDYAEKLRRQTDQIFALKADVQLPAWSVGLHEDAYNAHVRDTLGGVLLDRKLIYTELHRRGIEVCDVLLPDGTLVHVKLIDSSAPASHLLGQALVSTDALLHDEQARQKFVEQVKAQGGSASDVPARIERVILGVAREKVGKVVTSSNLFTFTQVTLVRNVMALRGRGVEVFVAPIERVA